MSSCGAELYLPPKRREEREEDKGREEKRKKTEREREKEAKQKEKEHAKRKTSSALEIGSAIAGIAPFRDLSHLLFFTRAPLRLPGQAVALSFICLRREEKR
jgi:hypothetical protein